MYHRDDRWRKIAPVKHAISIIAAGVFALPLSAVGRQQSGPLQVREATIAQIESELKARRLTCHSLVQAYLTRIDAFDKKGPSLNAIVEVNPDALKEADNLDRRFASSGLVGPLHCVPMIVKDNFETIGLQSAAGSLAMKGSCPRKMPSSCGVCSRPPGDFRRSTCPWATRGMERCRLA